MNDKESLSRPDVEDELWWGEVVFWNVRDPNIATTIEKAWEAYIR